MGPDAIPPATYSFRLYSGKTLELYGKDAYRLDEKLCNGAYTGDDFCNVSSVYATCLALGQYVDHASFNCSIALCST